MLFKEIVDIQMDDNGWMVSDHSSSPWTFGSGELKKKNKKKLGKGQDLTWLDETDT